jgi:hypothetical protein
VPVKDLLTRSGPTRRQELARTRVHGDAEPGDSAADVANGPVCSLLGGCDVARTKAWPVKAADNEVLDPVMRHVAPNMPDTSDKAGAIACVSARFLHGIRGTFPALIASYLRRGTHTSGVGGALKRLLDKLKDRLRRLGCVSMPSQPASAAPAAESNDEKSAKPHVCTMMSHPESQWMCAEGRIAGMPTRVAVLLQLYMSTDTASKGDFLACCDLYCEAKNATC